MIHLASGNRTIETVLRLTGEGDYKTALRNCNAELKNLKSQLDLTNSEFRNNANSMEALSAKSTVLNQTYELQKEKISTLREALDKAEATRTKESETLEDLRSQYEEAKKKLSEYGDEVDKNSEEYKESEAAVSKLRDEIIKYAASLNTAEKNVSNYSNQLNKAQIELNNLDDAIAENDRLMDEAKQSADNCATSIDRYGNVSKQAADGTNSSATAVDALATAMVAGGIAQKVEDLAGAMMECAEASADFETAIAKVYTLADESVISEDTMKTAVMEIASEMGKSAEEIGGAVYDALSAGVDTANVIDFVRQSTQLSIAGFTEAGTAVDVLTTILNAYGLEADQTEAVASKLVKTQDLGKISVDDLGKVMGRVIPTAAAYSVDLDNIATAYANMTASGINAENTTTYLSTMMDELADSGSNVAGILQSQTGMSFSELMDSGKSLGDVVGILSDSVDGNSTAFSNLWSSATAGRGALALLNSGVDAFNATMEEMATSSGSVAKNYEEMSSTSEFASQRVSAASENLKIAIGDQLNPVLDNLRNAGANVLDVATRIVSNNPALMAVITGAVTALGLLTAGVSGLMIAKSAAAAMQALNIAMTANPVVLVATAVVGLGVAIATFVSQAQGANEELQALTASSQAFADTVQNANQSYEDTVTSTTAAFEVVDSYIDQLAELEAQGLKTKEQQQEYAIIVDQINATIPELNASIDEQTGLLEGGTDALRAQAEQWKNAALQEAAYTRYKQDIEALADAQYEAQKNQVLLNNARKTGEQIDKDLEDAQNRLEQASRQLADTTRQDGESVEEFNSRYQELQDTVAAYTDDVYRLQAAQSDNRGEIELYQEAVDACNETISEQTPFVEASTEAWASLSEELETVGTTAEEGTQTLTESTTESLEQLTAAYQQMQEGAYNTLDSQIGLFEKLDTKCDLSTRDMIDALKSQREAFDNYADNIQTAMERGIDKGLVQKLSDGTKESMAYLAELVTATDEEIAELNAEFAGAGESKAYLAGALDGMDQVVADAMDPAVAAAYSEGVSLGTNTAQGYIDGINSKIPAAKTAAGNLANAGYGTIKQVSQIRSPSRRWKWLGQMEAEGLITAHKEAVPKVEASSADLANAGYMSAIRSKQASIQSMVQTSRQTVQSGTDAQTLPLLRQILTAIKDGKILAINGDTFVGATANKYNSKLGQMQILAERGAK